MDVAPGVQVYIANPLTHLDLRNTVQWMTSQGVQIINHSVAWTWDCPGDGTSPFTDAPGIERRSGRHRWRDVANAAGNEAQSTWTGAFVDSDSDGWLEFQTGPQCAPTSVCALNALSYSFQESLHVGQQFVAQARWEDSWTAAARDLDLYLFQWNASSDLLTIVAGSETFQSGSNGEVPLEILAIRRPSACACAYYLAVHHFSGLDLVRFKSRPLHPRHFGTARPAKASQIQPRAPIRGARGRRCTLVRDTSTIEFFSSQGPTTDGRTKPDLVGADRGSTVSYGVYCTLTGGFGGTSQCSPHIAGLAALVLGAFPNTPRHNWLHIVRATATPHSPANTWGAGFAQVPAFPSTISVSAFLSDKTFPVSASQTITWRAFAIGGNGPFEYQFWVYDGVNWTLGQGYCPSNTFAWTPPGPGTYLLQVWARHVGSSGHSKTGRAQDSSASPALRRLPSHP